MATISICINADTRPEKSNAETMFNGVCNLDFLIEGVKNKQKFFSGFDYETILFIDEHLPLSQNDLQEIRELCDTVVVRKHTSEPNFNDWNYQSALYLCRGEIIAHFDQDTNAFSSSKESVQELINLLDNYKYVSYPSHWSPFAVCDPSFNYMWVSTRFFMCKKDTIDFSELRKLQSNYEYYIQKYNPSKACHWTEHILGNLVSSSVIYPPIDYDKLTIFSWGSYEKWTLRRLNSISYEEIKQFIYSKNGVQYPCDIFI
jgi:hypothetical protein